MSEAQAAWHQFVRRTRRLPIRARVATHDLTWCRWNNETVRHTAEPPNSRLAVVGDYLFVVHGTPSAMCAIIEAVSID